MKKKRGEVMEKGVEDGISALPDCLLLEILSRLPSLKDAIRTGTLSKRWEHLWASTPTLIFTVSDHPPNRLQNPNDFALLVDKTLSQCCQRLKLQKFEVHTYYDIRLTSQYNNWIRYAISCSVEELTLDFWGTDLDFLLNQSIFINPSFTNLILQGCKLNPTGAISWENLRSLCLSCVNLDEGLIANIVSGSPLLETLVLVHCGWLIITSDDESESESNADDKIRISAPTSLSQTQCCQWKKFKVRTILDIQIQSQLNNLIRFAIRCNVKELNLDFWYTGFDDEFMMLDQNVFTSSCFTELTLTDCMLNPVGAISWKNLRSLCISDYKRLDEDLIENILTGSPVLESFVLTNCYGYRRLNITSKSVKHLVLSGYNVQYGASEADIIEINAPNVLSLTIEGGRFLCRSLLLNVSSSVKAYLNFSCTKLDLRKATPTKAEQEMLKGCIMSLRHVKELELGFYSSEVLSCLQAKGFVCPSNVKLTERM